jgi:peptidyl-prolyl cis-trans isomerase C
MRSPVTLLHQGLLLISGLAPPRLALPLAALLSAAVPSAALLSAAVAPAALAQSTGSSAPGFGPGSASVANGTGTPGDASAPVQGAADPVVGSVEGHPIYLSELGEAAKTLPDNLRGLPFDTLYPVLLDRLIDHEALVMMARRKGLEENRQVEHEIQAATERILEGAYLAAVAAPVVTEQAIQARYNRLYGNRPATEEVHASHILVATEAEARTVLDELQKGGDFATIARVMSKDPDAVKGGDLGFFRREQVWPGFADVAFALQPGQVGPNPIHNEFGWHVIKVEEKRLVAPPSFSDVHDQLRQDLLAASVQRAVADARGQLDIHRFNLDGSEISNAQRMTGTGPANTQVR